MDKLRPIALIETGRRIFSKIITKRMDAVITTNKILQENNWAGTTGGTTTKPRIILQNMIEDAQVNKKEMWILLQDTKKAFDSVGKKALKITLERIGTPSKLIKIILEIRENRSADVITKYGITQEYRIKDGLDQGDLMSPLLWKIFYDSLISKINKTKYGYNMSSKWTSDYNTNTIKEKEITLGSIVYMDDTTWMAKGKKEMERILQIAEKFYYINDIEVNAEKSKLIVLNTKKRELKIDLMGKQITASKEEKAERFLGSWIQRKPG